MIRIGAPVCVLFAFHAALAQGPAGRPAFEAASVKSVAGGHTGLGSLRGGPGTNSPGRLTGVATLKLLLMRAYDLKDYQIAGPGWLDSSRYELQATFPADASREQVALMLQQLLQERFQLQAHRETRQLAASELVVAKGGPKLSPASPAQADETATVNPRFRKGSDGLPDLLPGTNLPRSYSVVLSGPDGLLYKLWGRHETLAQLADRLSAQLNRPVIDATRLDGEYDFTLAWAVESSGGVVPRTGPPPDQIESSGAPVLSNGGLPISGALQAQLGLRLEEKRRPVEVLVVDGANSKAAEN